MKKRRGVIKAWAVLNSDKEIITPQILGRYSIYKTLARAEDIAFERNGKVVKVEIRIVGGK